MGHGWYMIGLESSWSKGVHGCDFKLPSPTKRIENMPKNKWHRIIKHNFSCGKEISKERAVECPKDGHYPKIEDVYQQNSLESLL